MEAARRPLDHLTVLTLLNYFRSPTGHRLERDVETGGLTTRHHRKAMQIQKGAAERGLDDLSNSNILLTPTSSEVVTPTTPSGGKFTFCYVLIRDSENLIYYEVY